MKRLLRVRLFIWKLEKWIFQHLTAKRILYIGFVCILLFPWIFTRTWGKIHFNTDTGVIGDTIGGITGPVSGFLGAVLVYLALKEQIKANKIITEQFREQKAFTIVNDQLTLLRAEIKEFNYTHRNSAMGEETFQGAEGIKKILNLYPAFHERFPITVIGEYTEKIREIRYFLDNLEYLLGRLHASELKAGDKRYLIKITAEVYLTKLYTPLAENESKRSAKQKICPECKTQHGLPEGIYKLHDSIKDLLKKNGYKFK